MFSAKTRSQIYNGVIGLVWAGLVFFLVLVLWPLLRQNREHLALLQEGAQSVVEWQNVAPAELPSNAYVAAAEDYVGQVETAYRRVAAYYVERDAMLERSALLRTDPDHAFHLKEDYDKLIGELSLRSRRFSPDPSVSLTLDPAYPWAGAEGTGEPASSDYADIVKRACMTDAIVRVLTSAESRAVVQTIRYLDPPELDGVPPKQNVKDYGALRYEVRRAEVVFDVLFSQMRQALEQVLKAPGIRTKAPLSIYPPYSEVYYYPVMLIRELSFKPVRHDWAQVTLLLDIYDFEQAKPAE